MFCSSCGLNITANSKFCSRCGKDTQLGSSSGVKPGGQFGRVGVKSFIDYKASNGRPDKGKGKKGKREHDGSDKEAVISIGLMAWNANDDILKERRGKRLALRVPISANYKTLLERATTKWKNFHSNLFEEGSEYALLLEDGQKAQLLPGSSMECFTLNRYKEELMKDYKRITLFLCTIEDLSLSQKGDTLEEGDMKAKCKRKDSCSLNSNAVAGQSTTCSNRADKDHIKNDEEVAQALQDEECKIILSDSEGVDVKLKRIKPDLCILDDNAGPSGCSTWIPSTTPCNNRASEVRIKNDEKVAWALQQTFDQDRHDDPEIKDEASVINAMEERVLRDGKDTVYMVVRRQAPLERIMKLWQRATDKVFPEHILRVKYLGENGIDTGALAKEFITKTISNIGAKFFPNGSPMYSTNDICTGNYKSCGELAAVSLAQGGPPPCFLEGEVYRTLVTDGDLDFTSRNLDLHLTPTEMGLLDQVKSDVLKHQDAIIDHGYTGPINEANSKSIQDSIVVSILSRRITCLKEFGRGLNLYGLKDMICKHPEATRSLFVRGQQNEVDANYVVSLLKPELSVDGSNRRVVEDAMMDYFQDFLMSIEDERLTGYTEAMVWASGKGNETDGSADEDDDSCVGMAEGFNTPDITPAGVLGWLTGAKHREICGADLSIKVKFDHDCLKRNPKHTLCFPVVMACGRSITFPVMHMNTHAHFRDVFLLGFSKSQAFGMS